MDEFRSGNWTDKDKEISGSLELSVPGNSVFFRCKRLKWNPMFGSNRAIDRCTEDDGLAEIERG